jgi:hypothetical protein
MIPFGKVARSGDTSGRFTRGRKGPALAFGRLRRCCGSGWLQLRKGECAARKCATERSQQAYRTHGVNLQCENHLAAPIGPRRRCWSEKTPVEGSAGGES